MLFTNDYIEIIKNRKDKHWASEINRKCEMLHKLKDLW